MDRFTSRRTISRRRGFRLFTWPSSASIPDTNRKLLIETLERRMMLAADPMISEFQAVNATTISDEDGDSSDWIEIRNPNAQALDLNGWYLTDDATNLSKWRFPAVSLGGGDQLIVFASGKDRTDSTELHTNFRLSGDGEYLALVKPDGLTIAQDFGASFPKQFEDQSSGLAFARNAAKLLDENAPVRVYVPTDDSLGLDWTRPEFNDSSWLPGAGAVGFEDLMMGSAERDDFDGPLGPEWTVDLPDGAASTVEIVDGGLRVAVPARENTTADERGSAPLVYRDVPGESPTDWEIITHIQKDDAARDRGSIGIVIYDGATGKPALLLEQTGGRSTFKFSTGPMEFGRWTQLNEGSFFLRLVRDEIDKTWSAYAKLEETDDWTQFSTITDGIGAAPVIADPKPGLVARAPTGQMNAQFTFAEIVVAPERASYGSEIRLDVGEQMLASNGSIYMRMPFRVQGDPARFDIIGLGARYDDGFKAYLNGVEITSQNAPINANWNSTAAGVHGAVNDRIPLQRIELNNAVGALREGDNVLAIHGMNAAADDSDFFFHTTLVASELLPLTERVFTVPSPGSPNLLPSAPAPRLLTEDGIFFGSKTVELALEDVPPTLEIRYTLDGTQPTLESTLYTGPFQLTGSAMLQARTFDTLPLPNLEPSNITNGTFIAVSEQLRDRTSNMPLMIIDTLQQGLPDAGSNDLRATNVALFDVSQVTGRASIDKGVIDYFGRAGARDRGSSTAGQPKPNMVLETWGPQGSTDDDDFDTSLLGLPAESDWVLHAPFHFDRAMIRNQFVYELSNQMGMWAPHSRFMEVYLNRQDAVVGEDDYVGVYVLMEKIKQGDDRVDVTPINPDDNRPPDISGGYIWKIDRPDPDAPRFDAGRQPLNWVYPKSPLSVTARPAQMATPEQESWVQDYFAEFDRALQNPDINDPDGYAKFIDVNAWIDQHFFRAIMKEVDSFSLSTFLHKDRNGKLVFGPVWDFDRSAESLQEISDDDPLEWQFLFSKQIWFIDLSADPGFWQLYVDRWQMWRQTVLSDENINALITSLVNQVGEAAERNFERWPQTSPRTFSPYHSGFLDGTYQGEVNHLRAWLDERLKFLDDNFAGAPEFIVDGEVLENVTGLRVSNGQEIDIVSAPIDVFDDTKLISGAPGESTARFFVPSNDDLGETWTLPAFDDSAWAVGPSGLGFSEKFAELIVTEVDPREIRRATNILARYDFHVSDLAAASQQSFVLRMKYDDGFVAYLNGVEVTRRNFMEEDVEWNTRASRRDEEDAVQFQDIDLSRFRHLLVEGDNVLAIRGVNARATDSDMLILPELVLRSTSVGRNPAAKVYYTIDGSDPRGPDGNPSPIALQAKPGERLTVTANTRVIARNFDATDRGPEANIVRTDWSSPVQYDFVVTSTPLVVSEINYHPVDPTLAELAAIPAADNDGTPDWNSEDFEYVEVHNPGPSAAALVGVALSGGVDFDFTSSRAEMLAAGGYGLVVSNQAAFELRYGSNHPILGEYTGKLNNNGETLRLLDGAGDNLFSVNFGDKDPWPIRADGFGSTLELIDANTPFARQSKYDSWRASSTPGGSPGSAGPEPVGVVINEVVAHTQAPVTLPDSIELYNPTGTPIDIGGWYLSDSADNFLKFQIPPGTTLAAGQYLVFDESHFNPNPENPGPHDFALSGDRGDDVWLTVPDGAGGVASFVDDIHFRETANGESLARIPNGSGRLTPALQNSFGNTNGQPRVGPVVITELHYNPGLDSSDLEFIEIHNPTAAAADLTNWRIRGGVEFDFADGTSLGTKESVVIVSFDPHDSENAKRLSAFRTQFALADEVRILGGYRGRLSNAGDRVVLLRATASPPDRPNFVPRVQEDEVLYDDLAPWPILADGSGASLTRTALAGLGSDASNWTTSAPSPGTLVTLLAGDANGDGVFDQQDVAAVLAANKYLSGRAASFAEGDWNGDGIFNQLDIVAALQHGGYRPVAEAAWRSLDAPLGELDDLFAQIGLP